jgi:hypothetical protein
MYGPEMFAFFVLCVVLFIGEVFYNEAFSDCSSPGALTWTITMNPGDGASMCSSGSGSSDISGDSSGSGSGSSSGSSGSSGSSSGGSGPFQNTEDDVDNYGHPHNRHHRKHRIYDDDDYGYSTDSIEKLWRDISGSDISGTDISGNPLKLDYNFNLSLSDLLSLVGKTIIYGDSQWYNNNSVESRYQRRLRQMKEELEYPRDYGYEEYFQNCNSPSNDQAIDYIQRKKGINMDDYIRKDSIPCYGCTLP